MIKRIREERGGFTLAELLVVVAIVAVLVAIAVPVFTGALGSADKAVADANERSVKAEATTKYLTATTDADRNAVSGSIYYANEKGDISGPYKASDAAPADAKFKYTVTVTPGTNGGDPTVTVASGTVSGGGNAGA